MKWMDDIMCKIQKLQLSEVEKTQQTDDLELYYKGNDEVFILVQEVYNIILKELIRQVSAHCIEWGWILFKIFTAYKSLIESCYEVYKRKGQRDIVELSQKLNRFHEHYESAVKEAADARDLAVSQKKEMEYLL